MASVQHLHDQCTSMHNSIPTTSDGIRRPSLHILDYESQQGQILGKRRSSSTCDWPRKWTDTGYDCTLYRHAFSSRSFPPSQARRQPNHRVSATAPITGRTTDENWNDARPASQQHRNSRVGGVKRHFDSIDNFSSEALNDRILDVSASPAPRRTSTSKPYYVVQDNIASANTLAPLRSEALPDFVHTTVFKSLPARDECLKLLKVFFNGFNQLIPLYLEESFMHLISNNPSPRPFEGNGLWASLNVALAIGSVTAASTTPSRMGAQAWGYLKNALSVTNELTMYNADSLSVQALLGMTLFFRGASNAQPSFSLLAAATRSSHALQLHRRRDNFQPNDDDDDASTEQKKRIFWITYFMDKEFSLRSGRPSIQDDNVIDVDLPSETPLDGIGTVLLAGPGVNTSRSVNSFRLMCDFSRLTGKLYAILRTAIAPETPHDHDEVRRALDNLTEELEEWKDSLPSDVRPGHEVSAAHWPLKLHIVSLNFAYHHCVAMIFALNERRGPSQRGSRPMQAQPYLRAKAERHVNSARASIRLIKCVARNDLRCIWVVLHYPVSALVILFANILRNPRGACARFDLGLISSMVVFLAELKLKTDVDGSAIERMYRVCARYERTARKILRGADGSSQDAF